MASRGLSRRRTWRAATMTLRTKCAARPIFCMRLLLRHLVISPPDRPSAHVVLTVSFARSLCAWQAVSLSELLALAELPQPMLLPATEVSAAGIEEAAERCTRTVRAARTCGACCACCTCTCDACRACGAARERGQRGVDREVADAATLAAAAAARTSKKRENASRRQRSHRGRLQKVRFNVTIDDLDAGRPSHDKMRRVARVAIATLSNQDGVYVACDKTYRVSAQRRAIASAMRASGVSQLVVEADATL